MDSAKPAKKQKYTGFSSYLVEHKITKEFVRDYEYWTKKIFYHWKLFTDYETFQSICWEALLSKLPEFDPSIATIQTFCLSRINNEAWRFYMKTKNRKVEIDCENPVIQGDLIQEPETNPAVMFCDFVRYAKSMGVWVDVDELYNDYKEEKCTPATLAFTSWKMRENDVGGDNGI
jgi:hypothetical protein